MRSGICSAIVAAAIAVSDTAWAQTVKGSVALPFSFAEASVNPNTDRLFLGRGYGEAGFTVVNVADAMNPAIVTTISSGGAGIVVNPSTNLFYTSTGFGGQVLRLDGGTLATTGGVSIGPCPGAFDVDPSTNLVYVLRQCAGGGAPAGVDPLFVINGATMAIVGSNLGTGGVAGNVRVNPTTGKAYVNRSGSLAIFGPAPTFALLGTRAETIGAVNPVANRTYNFSGSNLVVRNGADESLITTIPNAAGSAAVNTSRNRIYVVTGGVIKVIDGVSNTVVGTVELGPGVAANGVITVDSTKDRIYAVGISGGSARLYVIEDVPEPICEVEVSQSVYNDGQALMVTSFRLANQTAAAVATELKVWFGSSAFPPISMANLGADGSLSLAAGSDWNSGPFSLGPVTSAWPRADYELGCRLLHPVTGEMFSESLATFSVQ